jgi:tetratricopeptide (TPR) repeat protein
MNRQQRRATRKNQQKHLEQWYASGVQLQQQGRLPEAEQYFRRVLEIEPRHVNTLNQLGLLAYQAGNSTAAVQLLKQAVDSDPQLANAWNNLGVVYRKLGLLEDAERAYQEALALRPSFAEGYWNLGRIYTEQGRSNDACEAYRAAIRHKPTLTRAHLSLVQSKRILAVDDPDVAALEALHRDAIADTPQQQTELHFALGKVYDDLGRFDDAFQQYRKANQVRKALNNVALQRPQQTVVEMKKAFSADSLRRLEGSGYNVTQPVFIVGMPRSGTTLLESLMTRHPQIHGAGELRLLASLESTLQRLVRKPLPLTDAIAELTGDMSAQLGKHYDRQLQALCPSAGRIIDKMPENFWLIGLIHLTLPGARIIHCRRNPLDTIISCYQTLFASGHEYTYDLDRLADYYLAYMEMMEYWRSLLPQRFLELDYERLVTDPRAQLQRAIAHLDLEWQDTWFDAPAEDYRVQTASVWQVRQPVYQRSMGRWRHYRFALEDVIKRLQERGIPPDAPPAFG